MTSKTNPIVPPALRIRGAVELEKRSPSPVGLSVSVDPKVLIESIRVAPQTPPWQTDVVRTIVNRLLPEVPVLQSELDDDPLY